MLAVAAMCAAPAAASAPPRAVITGGPSGEVPETTATFTFEASESAPFGTFECRLDAGPWRRCSSPQSYGGLGGGGHRFEVRLQGLLTDGRPETRDWMVATQTEVLPPAVPPPAETLTDDVPPRPQRRRDAGGCPHGANRVGEVADRAIVRAVVCLVNRTRARRGLRRLRTHGALADAAAAHARDMVTRRYFAHASRSGATAADRIRRTGYLRGLRSWTIGEVLAWGSPPRATPRWTVRAWMRSRPHRDVLLNGAFREIGADVARGTPSRRFSRGGTFVAEFGRRG